MKTLYLRNVPEEVVGGLEALASREGMSTSAFAVRELALVAQRARNAELLAQLPTTEVARADVLAVIREGREQP